MSSAAPGGQPVHDALGRPARALRLSVTDRCNLRCRYCMPEERYRWLPRGELLDFDELCRAVGLFCRLGVERVRLTGGEPLLRRDLDRLVAMLVTVDGVREVAMTTNGVQLGEQVAALCRAGLSRVTVSLDTLRPERFWQLTRRHGLDQVLAGLEEAARSGLRQLKIDTVVMRGVNDDELGDLLRHARQLPAELRFIEYMDVGGATTWSPAAVVGRADILAAVGRAFGEPEPLPDRGSSPAERFRLPDGTVFGVVASITAPFCRACVRSRLTADGSWYHCLYAGAGVDLKKWLRGGLDDQAVVAQMADAWRERADRGAEMRAALRERSALVPASVLRGDPHLEMHTRGG